MKPSPPVSCWQQFEDAVLDRDNDLVESNPSRMPNLHRPDFSKPGAVARSHAACPDQQTVFQTRTVFRLPGDIILHDVTIIRPPVPAFPE